MQLNSNMATNNIFDKIPACILIIVLTFSQNSYSMDARDVMSRVDDRYRGENWIMDSNVLLIDKNKRKNKRKLRIVGKMFGKDEKTLTYILDPVRLRGTGILSYDWHDTEIENESWLYLPDLGKVTRLTTANRGDYFLGTDFTYGDLEGLEVDDFNYVKEKVEKNIDDEVTLVATPVSKRIIEKYGYEKIVYWIDTEKYVIKKAKYWLKDKGWKKYYRQFDFKKINGAWVSGREQMLVTKQDNIEHTSIITRSDVRVNVDVNDSEFTIGGLEKASR